MTYAEYKKLHEEWGTTDSISRKEELEEEICDIACDLLSKLVKKYAKWGRKFVDDDDYRTDSGGLSLVKDELGYDGDLNVWLNYYDHWKYGGECDFNIKVPMKYLDEENMVALEADLRKKRFDELNCELINVHKEIERLTERKAKLQEEVGKLRKEIDQMAVQNGGSTNG